MPTQPVPQPTPVETAVPLGGVTVNSSPSVTHHQDRGAQDDRVWIPPAYLKGHHTAAQRHTCMTQTAVRRGLSPGLPMVGLRQPVGMPRDAQSTFTQPED